MAKKPRRNTFSSIRNQVHENQMTFINAAVTIVLIGVVIIVLLNRASAMQQRTVQESLMNLAGMTANETRSYILNEFNAVRNVGQLLANYEGVAPSQRRAFFDENMRIGIETSSNMINLFSIWRPNSLDELDARYANTEGTDETGQYMNGYTRENGWVEQKTFGDFKAALDLSFAYNSRYATEIIGEPRSIDSNPFRPTGVIRDTEQSQGATWVVDIFIPIMGRESTGIIGIIGATIDLRQWQIMSASTQPFETGRIFVCSSGGVIASYPDAAMRGTRILNPDVPNLPFSQLELDQVQQIIVNSIAEMKPIVQKTKENIIISYPFRTSSTMTFAVRYSSLYNPPWTLMTTVPLATIMGTIYNLLRFSILFIIGAGGLAAFVFFASSRSLTQQSKKLQQNLERSTAMQDNLKYGLFLMDDKYKIQGAYSKALEKILTVPSLQEKNFIELLGASLKEHEKEGFRDYLEMIFKRSFDEAMLESINPINEFTYFSNETGEKKSLRTSFKLAEGGRGSGYILGTMEDITAEKQLQSQLLAAEGQMEKEMRSLFEVLQLNPRVLSDFIEDTEYEFTAINEVLKRKEHIRREVMFELYQSVHAVKSNALILNLENFSARLHDLESSIKIIQEKNEDFVPFDDLLGLILEIDEALKEKDNLKAAISKIEDFRRMHSESGNQEVYVLVETLTQVCRKTQAALDKKVKLVVEGIDDVVLDYGPRRVIKEVLTQLVRNSIYHGIESPSERVPLGKEPEGELRLSIKYRDNQILIKFTDNGKGIDFNQVRQRALANKLFRNPSDANDKNQLLKALFSPGFSTLDNADLHGGRGVGLSLVKDRIKDLLGNITVSTAPGRGTTFSISIPMELPALVNKES